MGLLTLLQSLARPEPTAQNAKPSMGLKGTSIQLLLIIENGQRSHEEGSTAVLSTCGTDWLMSLQPCRTATICRGFVRGLAA